MEDVSWRMYDGGGLYAIICLTCHVLTKVRYLSRGSMVTRSIIPSIGGGQVG